MAKARGFQQAILVISITGSGGQHWLFQYPKGYNIANAVALKGLYENLDIRSNNGYIVLPPSMHYSGHPYEWDVEHHPEDMDLAEMPTALVQLLENDSPISKSIQTFTTPWEPLPLDIAATLPEVCERLRLNSSDKDEAAKVKYPEWIGMATWARAAANDMSLFETWSRIDTRFNAHQLSKKWKETEKLLSPSTCQAMQSLRPLPQCETCPIFQSQYKNPVAYLRAKYGDELGLNQPYGAPSYVDALRTGFATDGLEYLTAHQDLIDKAKKYESNEFLLWAQEEGLALALESETESDLDDDYFDNLTGEPSQPKLTKVVDNSEKLKPVEEQLNHLMELLRNDVISGPKAADQAIPLFMALAQSSERQAKIYARSFVKADKKKTITEKIIWDAVKEEIEQEEERKKQEYREKKRKQAKEQNSYDANQTGFQRQMAEQWALANQERFIYYDQKGAPHYLKWDLAKALEDDFHMQFGFDGIFAFNGCYYEESEKQVKGFIQEAYHTVSPVWGDSSLAESTYRTLMVQIESVSNNDPTSWYDLWDADPYIVFKNGVLDMTDPAWPALKPFSPDYRCTWSVECDWNVTARNDDVDRYLKTTLPDPVTRQSLIEYLGYALCRFDQSQQRYALLYGSGRNGKGIFINVLNQLFKKSSATCSLKELAENRFSAYQLLRSAVNIVGDMSGERLENTEMLKQITGNDTISAEQKFKAQFRFKPRTKLIFALNELPSTSDPSHGFFRRPLLYPFRQRFEGAAQDATIESKISTPEALSYWAFLAISAYGAMQSRNEKVIVESEEMMTALHDYKKANDIVTMAVEDGIIEFGADYTIPRELLHMAIEIYAESLGRKSPASNKLIERIRNAPEAGEITEARLGSNGQRIKVWKGIRLGEMGKMLSVEKEFINQDTKEVMKASTPIENFFNMGK